MLSFRTMITVVLLAAYVPVGGTAASAAPAAVTVDRVVAVVNDEIITMSDLQRELQKRTDITDERLMLEDMIDRKLQMAAAKKNGLDVSDKELNDALNDIMKRNNMNQGQFEAALAREGMTLEQYRTEFREQMTISRLFNKYVRTGLAVDDAEIREYYEKNRRTYEMPEEIRIRHLVVAVPEKATEAQVTAARDKAAGLMARLRNGEDFVKLIRESSDSATAAQDGDLGFMQREHVLPELEKAAQGLKPGEYAGPVRTADGYQIIRLEEVRTPLRPLEKVKDEISKILFEQKMENTYRTWLQSLRIDAHIENRL